MIITAIVLIVLLLIYYYGTRNFNYWAIKGVKHEKPIWLFGNNIQVYTLRKSMTQMSVEYYNRFPNERVVGFFRGIQPELLVRDPEIVKIIITTDFNSFHYRGLNQHKTVIEPLMKNLFFADGDLWRLLRQRMTPAFTSGKLKAMFPLIVECTERLQARVLASGINARTLDTRDLMARYTTDFIGAVSFGLDAGSLNDEESEFRKLGVKMFEVTFCDVVKKILKEFFPKPFKHFHLFGKVERDIEVLVAGILKKRNYEPSGRNDFIDLMLECMKKGLISAESLTNFKADGSPEIATLELTEELIAAQVFVFFGAGFETSTSATSFTLHQLAYNPDVQKRVQKDIDRVLAKYGKLCYDAVQEMRYLEWTFKEGMRMFPSLGFLYRECARKYNFEELNLSVDEGIRIMIPLQALHNDPEYFEEPHKFRPERFDPAECNGMNKFVYLPFGDGPRGCIDMKIRVKWYKESSLLGDSADMHTLLPPRFRMHHNFSLQVDALESSDTAQYTCEILRPEPWGPIRQTHAIEVQYPPTVTTVPEDGFLEVKKGEYVDIGCETTGTPQPIVNWRKNGEGMALLEHRSRIRFRAEHRSLGGVYECVVKNGVGDPVTAHITVVIHDAPEVSVERSFVHTAIGLRAALAAKVEFAIPAARTSWYKDGRPVKTDDRIVWIVHDNIHELIFRSVRRSDLGNYTFRAENKLGMADVSFKLTGVPNVASFKVDQSLNKATSTSFTLIWEVDSYSTIIEYNLWLRPYYGRLATSEPDAFTTEAPANMWSKIVVPGDSSDGPIHSAIYTVRGLTPTTVYEAIVTSRNRFGWSKPSSILHFATEPGAGRSRPSTSDYTDITPILEEYDSEPHNITQAHIFGKNEAWSRGERETPCMVAILMLAICIRM